jgi:putative peptidoglycan lipid II flippase
VSHSRFLSSAALVAALSTLTGALALAREGITARYFGRGDEVEAFIIAALVPMLLINAVGNSIGAGFVPTLLRIEHTQGRRAASDLVSSFLAIAIGLIAVSTAIAAVAVPLAIPRFAAGFTSSKLELAQRLFFTLLPVFPIGAIGRFWLAILNGYERFAAGVLVPAVVPGTVIIFLLTAPQSLRLDALVYGVTTGFVLQFLAALYCAHRAGLVRWPRVRRVNRLRRSIALSQYFPMLAGTLTLLLLDVVETTFAAFLGSGVVAAVNYASKLAAFVLGFVGSAFAVAVVPYYARLRHERSSERVKRFLRFGEIVAMAVGGLVAATVAIGSAPIVALVFEGGRFGAADTTVVATLNALFILAAPANFAGAFYGRLLLVEGHSRTLLSAAVLSIICAVLVNLALAPLAGAYGIPIATAVAYLASALWLRAKLVNCVRAHESVPGAR